VLLRVLGAFAVLVVGGFCALMVVFVSAIGNIDTTGEPDPLYVLAAGAVAIGTLVLAILVLRGGGRRVGA
jgi:hypothetical protein